MLKENLTVEVSLQTILESASLNDLVQHVHQLQKPDDALVADSLTPSSSLKSTAGSLFGCVLPRLLLSDPRCSARSGG